MGEQEKVNILLVDDQPAKLLSYEVILAELGETLLKAGSASEALEHLLKADVAVILVDVVMPELDGFQLATMIREHPRFNKIPIIFISAIQVEDVDRLHGYKVGAVDYVPVPVVPEVLRAKVRVFAELYRKTRDLERLNRELELRVSERTAMLENSIELLRESEERRSLALSAGRMGSWDFNIRSGEFSFDHGQRHIFGIESSLVSIEELRLLVHPADWPLLEEAAQRTIQGRESGQIEFRIVQASGEHRWCVASAAASLDDAGTPVRVSGVTLDVTERKEAEQRQALLAREVDHRARNMLAVVQSILRLTRASSAADLASALDGRIQALARAHTLLSDSRWEGADLEHLVVEELAPYRDSGESRVSAAGPTILLPPAMAQTFALVLHELATNAAKYGALSAAAGRVDVAWELTAGEFLLEWSESGGPAVAPPVNRGFGTRVVMESIRSEFGGEAAFDWRDGGLHCRLTIPRCDIAAAHHARLPAAALNAVAPAVIGAKRLLVIEDEALVAMMTCEMLTDMGYSVVGPVSSVAEAVAGARDAAIDGAVVDLNLGGVMSYPVADELLARGLPLIFLTGYDAGTIDPRYASIPLLQKPIDERTLMSVLEACLGPVAGGGKPLIAAPGAARML